MTTISEVNIALTESRNRSAIVEQKKADSAVEQTAVSRLEQVSRRVRAKELSDKGSAAETAGGADSSLRGECTGGHTSNVSRFEAMRQRIKYKEMEAKGLVHDPE